MNYIDIPERLKPEERLRIAPPGWLVATRSPQPARRPGKDGGAPEGMRGSQRAPPPSIRTSGPANGKAP
jgi:hypothetical protein